MQLSAVRSTHLHFQWIYTTPRSNVPIVIKPRSLLVPSPESRIRAIPAPAVSAPQGQTSAYGELEGLVLAGYLTAIFLPLIGFIIGIILLGKNRPGSGICCIIVSLVCGSIWLAVISGMG